VHPKEEIIDSCSVLIGGGQGRAEEIFGKPTKTQKVFNVYERR